MRMSGRGWLLRRTKQPTHTHAHAHAHAHTHVDAHTHTHTHTLVDTHIHTGYFYSFTVPLHPHPRPHGGNDDEGRVARCPASRTRCAVTYSACCSRAAACAAAAACALLRAACLHAASSAARPWSVRTRVRMERSQFGILIPFPVLFWIASESGLRARPTKPPPALLRLGASRETGAGLAFGVRHGQQASAALRLPGAPGRRRVTVSVTVSIRRAS